MTTTNPQREASRPPQTAEHIASFRRDPPLAQSFPLVLVNGALVPGFEAKCGTCQQPVAPAMVHGRVTEAMPTVMRMEANAYCAPCERLIHIEGRFRAVGDSFQFEYPDATGRWQVLKKAPMARTLLGWFNRAGTRFATRG